MMSPLIPVMKRLPNSWKREFGQPMRAAAITRGYLEFFEPDAFVATTSEQFEASGLKRERSWVDPERFHLMQDVIQKEPGRDPYLGIGLSMDDVYHHLFRTEFQFRKRVDPRILIFEGGDPIASAFFEACYGRFPDMPELGHLPSAYREALGAETAVPSFEIWDLIERGEAAYPLYFTIRGLDQHFYDKWDETIFIFDPLDAADVIDFWNLRQFRHDVMPVNVHWLDKSRDLIVKAIRTNHRPLPSNPNGVMIGTSILLGRSLNSNQAIARLDLAQEDLPDGSVRIQGWYPPIWKAPVDETGGQDIVAPPLFAKSQEVQVIPEGDGKTIPVPRLCPDFIEYSRAQPGWVNVIRPRIFGLNDRFAEALPSAAYIDSDHYPPHSVHAQALTREGYLSFQQYVSDSSSFDVPTMQEAVLGWLKAHDIDAIPSDAGRVADQLIASAGGLLHCALFVHEEAIRLFDSMARSREIRADGNSEEYPGRTASITQIDAVLGKIRKKFEGSDFGIERFIEAGVLRLGIAVRCTHCTKENWYSLDDIGLDLNCDRCLKDFRFPQSEFPRREIWKYRVIGPFSTPHYAQGAYSVAHTLRFLERALGSLSEFTYTTSLELKHQNGVCETDFFAWHSGYTPGRASRDPTLLVGECKSFGTELFKAADVARLKQLGELFPGAYLVAAMLKKEPSAPERKRLKTLAEWGWKQGRKSGRPNRLIVLTGVELLGIDPLLKTWKDAGGACAYAAQKHRNMFDFATLAQATQEAHLGFADGEILQIRHPKWRR